MYNSNFPLHKSILLHLVKENINFVKHNIILAWEDMELLSVITNERTGFSLFIDSQNYRKFVTEGRKEYHGSRMGGILGLGTYVRH